MITIRPGSHVFQLLQLLVVAGEIPTSALSLIGNERVLAALVHKLESVQDIRFGSGGEIYNARLIQINGKKGERSIRLYRKALSVLDGVRPGLLDWYMGVFKEHSFSNDLFHIQRNHRVAEAIAACMAAGLETRPYVLPPLQKSVITKTVPYSPSFYIARDFKKTDADKLNKTIYTRIVGAVFYPGGLYAVYNTRDAVMKWNGRGEIKALGNLEELARMNAGLAGVSAALLFGRDADVALTTILESDKSSRPELRFDNIYTRIHFVPLNQDGVRLLKILVLPDWNERLLSALFEPGQRSYNRGAMEYDADVGGRKILSHLDGDIARLIRFKGALRVRAEPTDILCYPWQTGFVREYMGGLAGIRELEMATVEAALGG